MNKNFLPSKQFISRIVSITVIVVVIFGGYKLFGIISNKIKNRSDKEVAVTIKKSVQKDSNDNGIPDWEESLWGLNPNKNGEENKEFIISKRKAINPNFDSTSEELRNQTETDNISKLFFSVIMSLSEDGEIDDDTLNLISQEIGQRVESEELKDIYVEGMLNIIADSETAKSDYYNQMKSLVEKYEESGIGEELSVLSQGLVFEDLQSLYVVKMIGEAYRKFGEDAISISVPKSLSQNHLKLVNNYEKTGQSIESLSAVLNDPIVGIRGLLNYKKYSDELVKNLEFIGDNL